MALIPKGYVLDGKAEYGLAYTRVCVAIVELNADFRLQAHSDFDSEFGELLATPPY
jgi:hypothetical protein